MRFALDDIILGTRQDETQLDCSLGVMAFNEEANIGQLLQALVGQQTSTCEIREIIVVASGCTDNTVPIVTEFAARNPGVKLVVQPVREGKASAVNLFMRYATTDILVMVGADTIPAPTAIECLIRPFSDLEVGMTGGHPIPVNDPHTFMGFAGHLMWELHHQIALQCPKIGELTAFRRIFSRIPRDSPVDEASMEPLITGQGYQLRYVPEAIVRNRTPETVADLVRQRRRIYAGHVGLKHAFGYQVSTMSVMAILKALLHAWQWNWRFILWTPAVVSLELYGRLRGWLDFKFKSKNHAVWERVATTKGGIS